MLPGHIAINHIKGVLDIEKQMQPAGVDLTLGSIHVFNAEGYIGFEKRSIAKTKPLIPVNGVYVLPKGYYKVLFNEAVYVPEDCAGMCFPRSSLLRSGAMLICALWDPGYKGRGEALLVVGNDHGIRLEHNARIAQLVFLKVNPRPIKLYKGVYQGERLGD